MDTNSAWWKTVALQVFKHPVLSTNKTDAFGVGESTSIAVTRRPNAASLAMDRIVQLHLRISGSWLASSFYANSKDQIPQLSPSVFPIWLQTPQARLCLTEMTPSWQLCPDRAAWLNSFLMASHQLLFNCLTSVRNLHPVQHPNKVHTIPVLHHEHRQWVCGYYAS